MLMNVFDESNITWRSLDWLDHIKYYVYLVDKDAGIVDVLFKFAAGQKVMLHRHKAPYVTFVVQGELRFFRPDGSLKETREPGSYVAGVANGEPHTEGAGEQDAIVFFSNRKVEDALYEFLDADMKPITTLGIADFQAELDAQRANGSAEKVRGRAA